MSTARDVRKFFRYAWPQRSFAPDFGELPVSEVALAAARTGRELTRGPAILIHGVMPRSGTVFVGELLRLHPALYAYPHHVWELPFLQHIDRVAKLQEEFLWSYEQNMGKIGKHDFLPIVGAALIGYLHQGVPAEQRMLLKVPDVQYLNRFFQLFPHEQLVVLVRDGRDVVHSTLRTWPQLRFVMVCLRWRYAARMVLACDEHYRDQPCRYWLARFEDAVAEPESFVRTFCRRFGLDEEIYPYERIGSIPVHGSSTTQEQGKVTWRPVQKPGFNPVGRWQEWTSLQKRLFKWIAGRELVALGYCADLRW